MNSKSHVTLTLEAQIYAQKEGSSNEIQYWRQEAVSAHLMLRELELEIKRLAEITAEITKL